MIVKFPDLSRRFSLTHNLNEVEVINTVSKIIDLNHKKKISTQFIKKPYYGEKHDPNKYSIWRTHSMPGFFNKRSTARIDFEIFQSEIKFKVDDADIFIWLLISIFFGILSASVLIVFVFTLKFNFILYLVCLVFSILPFFVIKIGKRSLIATEKELVNIFKRSFKSMGYSLKKSLEESSFNS
jgi:hypothetical protein